MIFIDDLKEPTDCASSEPVENGSPLDAIKDLIEKYIPINQFIKFCIVGGIGTFLNLFILFFSVEFLGIWDIYALVIAFIVVVTFNFTLNKIWSFRNKEKKPTRVAGQYSLYVIIGGTGMGINILAYIIIKEYLGIWYLLAEFIAILIATLWNFEGARFLVFRARKSKKEKTA